MTDSRSYVLPFIVGFGAAIFPVIGVLWGVFATAVAAAILNLDLVQIALCAVVVIGFCGWRGFVYALKWLHETENLTVVKGNERHEESE